MRRSICLLLSTKAYRSSKTTHGRNMAGARALWRATGMTDDDFSKPIIAVANSFTQFVPGHVHLHNIGQMACRAIAEAGGVGREFNTIAVDDGIAMGHDGMLYSLPSRDLIADSVEYMVNAHVADALLCISNCDKITPGMLMAAMRLNIPTIFVSGGPMEAGKTKVGKDGLVRTLDLIDPMMAAAEDKVSDETLKEYERSACPTCGSCSGMFTANSMNCLNEALGLALPGNGSLLATHALRQNLFLEAAKKIVELARRYYVEGDKSVLPRSIVTRDTCINAMRLDIAMGGSTNTVLHLLALAHEGGVNFSMRDIDELSRTTPTLCKVAPSSSYHMEDVHRAGGIPSILGELDRIGLLNRKCGHVAYPTIGDMIEHNDLCSPKASKEVQSKWSAAPGGVRTTEAFSQSRYYETVDNDRKSGCIRSGENAYSTDGGLCVLFGNIAEEGCIVKTAGVDASCLSFRGKAKVFHSQDDAVAGILCDEVKPGECVFVVYEGPKGGPGMQEMLYPTTYIKSRGLGKSCALVTDGRFSGGSSGLSIGHVSPEAAAKGAIGLVRDGDIIEIDIPSRKIQLVISDQELAKRREEEEAKGPDAWKPKRKRSVSPALQLYASVTTSASQGAVRDLSQLKR